MLKLVFQNGGDDTKLPSDEETMIGHKNWKMKKWQKNLKVIENDKKNHKSDKLL